MFNLMFTDTCTAQTIFTYYKRQSCLSCGIW